MKGFFLTLEITDFLTPPLTREEINEEVKEATQRAKNAFPGIPVFAKVRIRFVKRENEFKFSESEKGTTAENNPANRKPTGFSRRIVQT